MKFSLGVLLGLLVSSHSAFASKEPKPIEILHMARILTSRQPLAFDVHAQPIESDRIEWAALCFADGPCTVDSHDRISVLEIEGEAAPKLWRPRQWEHLEPGDYKVVVAIGPRAVVRAWDALSVTVVQ